MASFVDYQPTNQGDNYTSRSRGTDRPQANQALGTLFEGIGSVVKDTVSMVDENNQNEIDRQLRSGVDAIRGAQGVDAAVNNQDLFVASNGAVGPTAGATQTGSTPPSIDAATGEVSRFTQAFKDGRISDTQYYAKVESLARQVRAKYPGYREIIDQKISSITGTNPANALRKSILEEIGTAQSAAKSKANSFETFFNTNLEHIPEGLRQRVLSGERSPTLEYEVRDTVGKSQVKSFTTKSMKDDLALSKARGEALEDKLNGVATKTANDIVNNVVNNGISTLGSGSQLQARINKTIESGVRLTAEEQQQMSGQLNQLTLNAELAIDKALNEPFDKDGTSVASVTKPERLKQIREQALRPLVAMKEALISGDMALFAQNANYAKAAQDQDQANLLQRSQAARTMSVAQKILGPTAGALMKDAKLVNDLLKDIPKIHAQMTFNEAVAGPSNGVTTSAKEQIQRTLDNTKNSPTDAREAVMAQVDSYYGILTSKNVTPQALGNAATMLFNPNSNFLDKFKGGSPQKVFAKFVSPEVMASMVKLKGSNPQAWENYKQWTVASFTGQNTVNFSNIRENAGPNGLYEIVTGPDGKLTAQRKAGAVDPTTPIRPGAAPLPDPVLRNLTTSVAEINNGIGAVTSILKEDGVDPQAFLGPFLGTLGIKAPAEGKDGGGSKPASAPLAPSPALGLMGDTPKVDSTSGDTARDTDFIEVTGVDDAQIDLDAQTTRRDRALARGVQSDPNWQSGGGTIVNGANAANSIRAAASELGVTPEDLATVISYETGGTFDPSIRGGAGNRHIGLIQFGQNEQAMYGATQAQSFPEQMRAVVKYLKHRGLRPGMDILDLYSTINAGSPGRYNASDAGNGGAPGTVRDKVNNQMGRHRQKALKLLSE